MDVRTCAWDKVPNLHLAALMVAQVCRLRKKSLAAFQTLSALIRFRLYDGQGASEGWRDEEGDKVT